MQAPVQNWWCIELAGCFGFVTHELTYCLLQEQYFNCIVQLTVKVNHCRGGRHYIFKTLANNVVQYNRLMHSIIVHNVIGQGFKHGKSTVYCCIFFNNIS